MRKFTFIIISFTLFSLQGFSQIKRCSSMEVLERQMKEDPSLAERMEQIETETEKYVNTNSTNRSAQAVINIPVVFHVVYNTVAENVPDYQLLDQLRILNEDFNKLNVDSFRVPSQFKSLHANMEINFCLAQRDPVGNPTNGITRTSTSVTAFSDNDDVKYTSKGGKNVWDRSKYLNIWVCDLGSGLLGYAQFPGGLAATDGVVVNYKYVGATGSTHPYDKGRTATHEVGHWLNLRHIWGDDAGACTGSDGVTDTPNQGDSNYGCPVFPKTDACSASSPGVMFMNYMDYVDDACMYMFSNGQKTRSRAVLTGSGSRSGLATSNGCIPPVALDAAITEVLQPSDSTCKDNYSPTIILKNAGSTTLTSATINYSVDGGTSNIFSWTGNLATSQSINVALPDITPAIGAHSLNVTVTSPNGGTDGVLSNDSITQSFTVTSSSTSLVIPFFEGFESATFPPSGWANVNPNANITWKRAAVGGFGTSTGSAKMDNITGAISIQDQVDILETPSIDLSAGDSSLTLTFNVAHARYKNGYYDSLFVDISKDCGYSWERLYTKGGTTLETRTLNTTSSFTPTSTQWRTETIDLSTYSGTGNAQLRFVNYSGSGNNIYVDDINVSNATTTGILQKENFKISIYPNPTSGSVTLTLPNGTANVKIYNSIGKLIQSISLNSGEEIDFSSQSNGIYFINIQTDNFTLTKRVTVNK